MQKAKQNYFKDRSLFQDKWIYAFNLNPAVSLPPA